MGPRAVAAAIAVVAAAALFLAINRTSRTVSEPRAAERVAAARSVAAGVDQLLSSAEQQTATIAAALAPWRPENPDRLQELGGLLDAAPLLSGGLAVIDQDGVVVTADPSQAQLVGQRRSEAQLPETPSEGSVLSGIAEQTLTGDPVIHVLVPVRTVGGAPPVTLRATMPLAVLAGHLGDFGVPRGAELVLVTPDELAIAPGAGSATQAGPNVRTPAERAATGPGRIQFEGEAGDAVFASYAPVRPGWSVVISDDAAALLGGFRSPIAVTYLVAALLIVAGLTLVLMERRRAREAHTELEQARRSLLAVAGHELRTPLTVVRGMARTLLGHWDQMSGPRQRELVATIDRQARSLEHLLERLLYVAELEAGAAGAIHPRVMDASEAVRSAAAVHAALALAHDVRPDAPRPVAVRADPKALDEILFHLLENAIRYSPGGGQIVVSARPAGRSVEILVEDEGVGLPADVESIFERFQQRDHVDRRTLDEGGLGLGLHIVRSLTEAMDGTVTAEHRQEGGARFRVRLPAGDPDRLRPRPQAAVQDAEEAVHAS